MARTPRGRDVLEQAEKAIASAKTAEELRAAQAVVLPLQFGLTVARTAGAMGVSVGWASTLRNRFMRVARGDEAPKQKRGGRRRQNLSPNEEELFLAPFLDEAKNGGVLLVHAIRQALETRLARKVALSSVYNLLHRHGWRKLAPDRRHPQADVEAQEAWKKNSPQRSQRKLPRSRGMGRSE
jgi:transposase